jgi:hypothetical protein
LPVQGLSYQSHRLKPGVDEEPHSSRDGTDTKAVNDASLWPWGHRPRSLGRRGGSGGNAQVLAPQEIVFEDGKIGAILGGGPPFFPSFFPPFFLPFLLFPLLSPQVYIQLML